MHAAHERGCNKKKNGAIKKQHKNGKGVKAAKPACAERQPRTKQGLRQAFSATPKRVSESLRFFWSWRQFFSTLAPHGSPNRGRCSLRTAGPQPFAGTKSDALEPRDRFWAQVAHTKRLQSLGAFLRGASNALAGMSATGLWALNAVFCDLAVFFALATTFCSWRSSWTAKASGRSF